MKKSLYATILLTVFYGIATHNSDHSEISRMLARRSAANWLIPLIHEKDRAELILIESNHPEIIMHTIKKLTTLIEPAKRVIRNPSFFDPFYFEKNKETEDLINKLLIKIDSLR